MSIREQLEAKYGNQQPTLSVRQQLEAKYKQPQPEQPKEEGFLKSLARGIAEPIAKTAVSGIRAGQGAFELGRFGFNKLAGDPRAERKFIEQGQTATKPINLPFLGDVSPVKDPIEGSGVGLQVGSMLGGGGAARTTVKPLLSGLIKQGSKTGFKIGVAGGAAIGGGKAIEQKKSLGDIAIDTGIGALGGGLTGLAAGGLTPIAGRIFRSATNPISAQANKAKNAIREGIDKGIRPYFSSNATPAVRNKYYTKAEEAFGVLNKYKNTFIDDAGVSQTRNPQTRAEMLDAIQNAKSTIYNRYDQIAKESGDLGARFQTNSIAKELQRVANDKGNSRQLRQYALEAIEDIQELNGASPATIQTRLREYNEGLQSFYLGRIDKAKARLDASIANQLRERLDDLINKTTGKNYQFIKDEYGALKSIEKDLTRQVALEARKSKMGLIDFTDVFTGGDLIGGIVTANPLAVARGLVGRGTKEIIKYLNDPNRYIRRAFDALDSLPIPPEPAITPPPILKRLQAPSFVTGQTKTPSPSSVRGIPAQRGLPGRDPKTGRMFRTFRSN